MHISEQENEHFVLLYQPRIANGTSLLTRPNDQNMIHCLWLFDGLLPKLSVLHCKEPIFHLNGIVLVWYLLVLLGMNLNWKLSPLRGNKCKILRTKGCQANCKDFDKI